MTRSACPRLSEAEALRDQRLDATSRSSFERHLASCEACSREVRALEALAAPLREEPGQYEGRGELHARRERARLLQAFDRIGTAASPQARARLRPRAWQLAAAMLGLAAGAAALLRVTTPPAPKIAVQADAATVWSGRIDGPHPKLVLERGALLVRVENGEAAPLRVVLPDGELEDIGTVFVVRAEDGHTTRVSVREGSVVLRLRGAPVRVIRAGETWLREVPIERPAASAGERAPSIPPAPAVETAAHAVKGPPERAAVRPDPARADPGRDFGAAVALLESGQNREAAAALARFAGGHPRDPRAEDAAYLRVLALHRAGDRAGVAVAARAYVRIHPSGLRRLEVEELARRAGDHRADRAQAP